MEKLEVGAWVTQYSAGYWQIVDLKPKYAEEDRAGKRKGDLIGQWALLKKGYHVMASRVPPVKADQPVAIRNYAFDYRQCPDFSKCDGDCFALFGGEISRRKADSLFAIDPRIKLVYADFYE